MPHVSTMGTFSCATIAIGCFKGSNFAENEAYLADPKTFGKKWLDGIEKSNGVTLERFWNETLYPTRQNLGRTAEYPFDLLMDELEKSQMEGKFIIATLNQDQQMASGGYWAKRLKHWGFDLIDITKNNIGSLNYIYTRNRSRRDMPQDTDAGSSFVTSS